MLEDFTLEELDAEAEAVRKAIEMASAHLIEGISMLGNLSSGRNERWDAAVKEWQEHLAQGVRAFTKLNGEVLSQRSAVKYGGPSVKI